MTKDRKKEPKCFISYSWDSDEHKDWVRTLATAITKNGVLVYLDQWDVRPGLDLPQYMETAIRNSDFVFLICTTQFAKKANLGKGGVGYEKSIVTGEIFEESASKTKYVPVLREGTKQNSLPSYIKSRIFVDFRNNDHFADNLEELLRHVYNEPRFKRPSIGHPPSYIHGTGHCQNKISTKTKNKMCPKCEEKYNALILAGGLSNRWQESISKKKNQVGYTQLNWKNVVKKLKELKLGKELWYKDRSPPEDVVVHKSCAMLKEIPLLAFSFLNYMKWGINDITVVINTQTGAYNDIKNKIHFARAMGRYCMPNLNIYDAEVNELSEIAHSVYKGFNVIGADERDTIVGYSDIVWEWSLLKGLLDDEDGDIVILVDNYWTKHNYPEKRIWHNKLFAEVLFGKSDHINKIGEAVTAFDIPSQYKLTNNIEPYDMLFSEGCREIVGLFKFSQKGREYFLDKYNEILMMKKEISMAPWPVNISSYENLNPVNKPIDLKKALLGNFLEFLVDDLRSKGRTDVKIKALGVDGRDKWAEIDHWGDILLAEDKIVDYLALQK